MKEKKISADWYIAATHWLTAGFAIPLIIGFVAAIPLALFFAKEAIIFQISISVLSILSVWLGVMYSASYVNKTYVIKNPLVIVKIATVYLVVIGGGLRLYEVSQTKTVGIEFITFIIGVAVFYFTSKRYIKSSEVVMVNQSS